MTVERCVVCHRLVAPDGGTVRVASSIAWLCSAHRDAEVVTLDPLASMLPAIEAGVARGWRMAWRHRTGEPEPGADAEACAAIVGAVVEALGAERVARAANAAPDYDEIARRMAKIVLDSPVAAVSRTSGTLSGEYVAQSCYDDGVRQAIGGEAEIDEVVDFGGEA